MLTEANNILAVGDLGNSAIFTGVDVEPAIDCQLICNTENGSSM